MDYIMGVLIAIKNKKLSSSVGFKGILKKILIFVVIAISNVVDTVILNGGDSCRTLTISFYFINEAISVLENISLFGLPLPYKLKSILEQFNS